MAQRDADDGPPNTEKPLSRWKASLRLLRRWTCWPPVGSVRFADLGSVQPISRNGGKERGTPVDDYYTKRYLDEHAAELQGVVIQLDGSSEAEAIDLGDERAAPAWERAARRVPAGCDGLVCRGILENAEDPQAAIAILHERLRPGGVLLIALDGIGPRPGRRDTLWGFTPATADRLFRDYFAETRISSFGNVRSAVACFQGIAAEELGDEVLRPSDPDYPLVVGVRAVRAPGANQ